MAGTTTVAIFETDKQAQRAIRALRAAGVDMRVISIAGADFEGKEHAFGFYRLGHSVKWFGALGAFWGLIVGVLFGAFILPVVGHAIRLGPLGPAILGGLEGAAFGSALGAFIGALSSWAVPRERAIRVHACANKSLAAPGGPA